MNLDSIRKKLSPTEGTVLPNFENISSVIFPLYFDTDWGVILTKRSDSLKSHPGQVSFPGGMYSAADNSLLETGLREWEEETGESRKTLEVLGKYREMFTRTGFHITSFLAYYTGNFRFAISDEVDFIFMVPFSEFQSIPFFAINFPVGTDGLIYYFVHERSLIWGATCEMIVGFLREFNEFRREPVLVKANLATPPFFNPTQRIIFPDQQ
ncbi:MAG: CoA pyrophosphatase [Leptospira sp.]|nr:CoA pyrophosphatase [Leptospira sp.]